MRISEFECLTIPVNERGGWLFLRLGTDAGLSGLGEASHGGPGAGRDARTQAMLFECCLPALHGRDPLAIADCREQLQPFAQDRAGATAVSACLQALWDIAGRAARQPTADLLGQVERQRIPLYANINRATSARTPDGFARNAALAVRDGFQAVKLAPFDGLPRHFLSTAEGRRLIDHGIACISAVRGAVGADRAVLVDFHSRFDVPSALRVAEALQGLGVSWFEEPVPTADRSALRELRQALGDTSGLELIGGEALYGLAAFRPYLEEHLWDVVMPDIKHCGGPAAMLEVAQFAAARGIAVAPHNPSGPVAMAASGHTAAVLPGFRVLEYAWGEVPWRHQLLSPAERIEGGMLLLPEGPGYGIDLEGATLAAHARR